MNFCVPVCMLKMFPIYSEKKNDYYIYSYKDYPESKKEDDKEKEKEDKKEEDGEEQISVAAAADGDTQDSKKTQ